MAGKELTTEEKVDAIEKLWDCKVEIGDLNDHYNGDFTVDHSYKRRPDYFVWRTETADGYYCYVLKDGYNDDINPTTELYTEDGVEDLKDEIRECLESGNTVKIDDSIVTDLEMETDDKSEWASDDFWVDLYNELVDNGDIEEEDEDEDDYLFFEEAKIKKEDNQ
jgi:hypothetical protein